MFQWVKKELLDYLHSKLKNRLSGWFAKTLSQGGKEVLLKTVAMAMPVYAMSCFKLPKATCESLSSAMSSFWWSSVENHRKIHWVAWDRLCLTKDQGGLGFKDIELFNQALLAKQAWRLLQVPDCLFSRFFKSRYFNESQFPEAECGSRPSFAWRSILHGRILLVKGLKQRVGNGESLKVWTSLWLEDGGMRAPFMKNIQVDIDLSVSHLIDQNVGSWDVLSLEEIFFPRDVDIIHKSKPIISSRDFMCWSHNKSGDYSVKSGYWLACQVFNKEEVSYANLLPSLNGLKGEVWKILAPSKIKVFLWKLVNGAIPVAERLNSRGMKVDARCQFCAFEGESINHLLFVCPIARQVWALSGLPLPKDGFDQRSIYQNFHLVLAICKNVKLPLLSRRSMPWILWYLWKNRKNLVIEGLALRISDLMVKISEAAAEWFQAQVVEAVEEEGIQKVVSAQTKRWRPPAKPWLKCNVASAWDREKSNSGAAWVLRNSEGNVLLHSRRSFGFISSRNEAELTSVLWAMESLHSLQVPNVIFALEPKDLVGAINRPAAWPSFKYQSVRLHSTLTLIPAWRVVLEDRKANCGAHLIAKSVTREERSQSYVAQGYPFWLQNIFESEKCIALM